jgi:hypothetical protein
MKPGATIGAPADETTELLGQITTPLDGLYRRHPERNLAAIGDAILGSYHDTGPVRLGPRRGLVVIAVDGLGYRPALATLTSADLSPLSSEFPTTTVACLMTSVTREPSYVHGFIGVQYLHTSGQTLVNCHDGSTTGCADPALARPTATPVLSTIFDSLADAGIPAVALPNELALLHADVRDRLLHGAQVAGPALPVTTDPADLVGAFADQITAATATMPDAMIWTYLDLDRHIHRHGFDRRAAAAMTALDELARRLRDGGTSVLVFSDHGLARSAPSPATKAAWQAATGERWCRLPPGGAGRVRWLYPHPGHADRLSGLLGRQLTDAIVVTSDQLAELGYVVTGSVGQRRLGEIILIATGADFPVPDAGMAYEHGSMTAEEVLIPMAIWSAAQ